MSNRKATIRNVRASLLYEIIALIYGLIVPRIILGAFGSEVNGLVSSLGQFLNYIALLEGGLSGVVMASLYKPLSLGDFDKVSSVLKATDRFFKKIAGIFVIYALLLGIIYPLIVPTSFSWGYIFSLTIIVALSLFIQYFFSLTLRMLIMADRKGYIIYAAQIVFTLVNLCFTLVIVNIFPEIHILKIFNVIAYILQPIIYKFYVNRHYNLNTKVKADETALAQRWDGFGQNIAFFIHTNTDVVILTFFSTLANVSVYAVYFMIANALKTLVISISSAVVPSIGNILATGKENEINNTFDYYEFAINAISTFSFLCGCLLITPFVHVYTLGVNDADYYQPVFGYILMAAEAIYCIRAPYVNLAYASGHFKQTARYAYVEAGLNILISIVLVFKLGLIGIAIGTLVAMLYRYIAHVFYLRKNIIHRPLRKWIKSSLPVLLISFVGVLFFSLTNNMPENYLAWFVEAIKVAFVVIFTSVIVYLVFFHDFLKKLFRKFFDKQS